MTAGSIPDSYRVVHVAIDSFEDRILKGRLYHASWEGGKIFASLSEMIFILEELFNRQAYPIKSLDYRQFEKKREEQKGLPEGVGIEVPSESEKGALADFILQVRYRYFATWQGEIERLDKKSSAEFESLLQFMDYLNAELAGDQAEEDYGLGRKMCEVSVYNYEKHAMGGDVTNPVVTEKGRFINEFDLKEKIALFCNPLPPEQEETYIIPREIQVDFVHDGPAIFVIRILFRRNGTWQGTVRWREKKSMVNFRSFLELLLLMHEAVAKTGQWEDKEESEE